MARFRSKSKIAYSGEESDEFTNTNNSSFSSFSDIIKEETESNFTTDKEY